MERNVRLILSGVGNVGRRFLELLLAKRETLSARHGLRLSVVGVADSSGAAIGKSGLDLEAIVQLKLARGGVADLPGGGHRGTSARDLLAGRLTDLDAECFLEASPANLKDGQPALSCIETALNRSMHVVTANKAPLVLAFPRLVSLAERYGVHLGYDATVAGGLPAVNLGLRDLSIARVVRLEGILNLTANYILTRMAEDGLGYDDALADAQAAGHAETDPSLDVQGWDAANKLVILANSVLGYPATLDDVLVEGIQDLTGGTLLAATDRGQRVKLVARAERDGMDYRLTVRPEWLAADHPLATLKAKQMGIVYHTDICGILFASIVEETPVPTAAAMLRDVVGIFAPGRWA